MKLKNHKKEVRGRKMLKPISLLIFNCISTLIINSFKKDTAILKSI